MARLPGFSGDAAGRRVPGGRRMQNAVAQRLGSALARSPSRASSVSQASRMADYGGGQPRGIDLEIKGQEMTQPGVCQCGSRSPPLAWTRCGVDIRVLAQPSFRGGGPVRHPQAVPSAVLSLEQRELRAGMRPFPAREDPHVLRPALELIPAGPSRSNPVSSATCASSSQQAGKGPSGAVVAMDTGAP
jgi:hypothetical protein